MLIPFALVCSCQKQDSTAEQQLAQRKTELDAREKALDEREKALAEREKLVAKPRVASSAPVPRIAPAEPQRTVPPELKGLMADPSQLRTEREQRMQERLAERQRKMEELQKMRVSGAYDVARQRLLPQNKLLRRVRRLRQSNFGTLVRRSFRKRSVNLSTAWQARARTEGCRWNRRSCRVESP